MSISASVWILAGTLAAGGEHGAVMGDGLELGLEPRPSAALNSVCAEGPTTHGIDVSVFQGEIDWDAVAADVDFALIRVSHSTHVLDQQFEANWNGAHAAGVPVGVYQYFEPGDDPIAQADVLLSNMGPLMPGDLPPVIDVESVGPGLSGEAIATAIRTWVEYVQAQTGVRPIIYTGPYFWEDNVGSNLFEDYPLWIAHYGTQCPLTPTPWRTWALHQYSSTGSTAGISGDVDQNTFNGTLDDLIALGNPGVQACGIIDPQGATIDDPDACYRSYGPEAFWRSEEAGFGGQLQWTNATEFAEPTNYAVWTLWFAEAGEYELEVYVEAGYAETQLAGYEISHAEGTDTVVVDQSASAGWVALGRFEFDADVEHRVRLDDNTGEANVDELAIVADALRVSRVDGDGRATGDTGESSAGDTSADDTSGGGADGTGGAGTAVGPTGGENTTSQGGGAVGAAQDEDGCACRAGATDRPLAAPIVLALLGLLGVHRRRSLRLAQVEIT